ncbi:hypothetical protein GBA52_019469 [Prunus armeniaca]|nr:hypothetical protein GBA52_019469 [Prunus armeniaca]
MQDKFGDEYKLFLLVNPEDDQPVAVVVPRRTLQPESTAVPEWFAAGAFGLVTLFTLLLQNVPIGFFGTITGIMNIVPKREDLLKVAAAGPLAGFSLGFVLLLLGFFLPPSDGIGVVVDASVFYECFLQKLLLGDALKEGTPISLNPLLLWAWAGLVMNAINSIPAGELDGGRISFAKWGRKAASRITGASIALLGLSSLVSDVAFYWVALMTFFLQRGPIAPFYEEITDPDDKYVGLGVLVLLLGLLRQLRYNYEKEKKKRRLPFSKAPKDDRNLPDMHLGLDDDVIVFDHVEKTILIRFPIVSPRLSPGSMNLHTRQFGPTLKNSNMTSEAYKNIVNHAKEHIASGDIFQIVLSQRFGRRTFADPFEVYRALRTVNPSPYLTYLQARGCILVASSPKILMSAKKKKIINRPLAGTCRRGKTSVEDQMLEEQLLDDEKQCAEHIMLVDLGRNDVGKLH